MSELKIQVLVAAMHQIDHTLIEKMNIQSDVIVANQCNQNSIEYFKWNEKNVTYLNFSERGVGLNRNNALMRADADICLFADEDMVYDNGYDEIVRKMFKAYPDADAIIFNIRTLENDRGRRINTKVKKVHIYNALNYGAARIAVRRNSVLCKRIYFSNCFGGGAKYSAGEDSLFICDMLKNGLKIYTSPDYIATVDQSTSTWFNGYNEKYLYDKGAFFKACFGKWYTIMCIQDLIRHKNKYQSLKISLWSKYKIMRKGACSYNDLRSWNENN